MNTRKIAAGVAVLALVGAGAYGGVVWWPAHQSRAAVAKANELFGYLNRVAVDVNVGVPQYQSGNAIYSPVTFTISQTAPQPPIKATIQRVTVTPEGAATLEQARFAVSTPDGDVTLGTDLGTIEAFEVQDGIPLHLKTQINKPSLAGPSIDKLKRQLGVVDLLLANAPASVQTIPAQILTSLGNLSVAFDLRYDPAKEYLAYTGSYNLPELLGLEIAFAANAVSLDAMKSANLLHDPALKAQENPALSDLSKGAVLSHLAEQGDLESVQLNLSDQGLLTRLVQIYGAITKLQDADARTKLVEIVNQYPVESLVEEVPTPETQQVLADARSAVVTVLKGEASRLVIEARPRDQAKLDELQLKLTTLNDVASALDIDVSARK